MAEKTKTKTTKAEGSYGINSWDEKTWDGKDHKDTHGAKLTHAKIVFEFQGDFVGEGEVQLLMSYRDDANAVFSGFQKMVGRLGGRSGSFVIQVDGKFENAAATSTWTILPGSGTGELSGITGGGETVAVHADRQPFTLKYSFE